MGIVEGIDELPAQPADRTARSAADEKLLVIADYLNVDVVEVSI